MDKNTCDIVRDLLPLVQDGVAGAGSRAFVAEHLRECPECRKLSDEMSAASGAEAVLKEESGGILVRQRKKQRRRSTVAGMIIGTVLALPVLVCLIVDLAVSGGVTWSLLGLNWFFIVLAAILLTASLTVLPLMLPRDRGLWTAAGGTVSLLLLLGVCCLYTRGNWFLIAASGVMLGLSVCILPFVLRSRVFREGALSFVGRHKALVWLLCCTMWLVLLQVFVGLKTDEPLYTQTAFGATVPQLVFAWTLFAAIRYLPGGLCKTGGALCLGGLYLFFMDTVVNALLGFEAALPVFVPSVWNAVTLDGNVKWSGMLVLCLVGLCLFAGGVARIIVKRNKK